jgi:cell division protein YceG involved in septum cleavage
MFATLNLDLMKKKEICAMNNTIDYETRSLLNRQRRQKQLRRYYLICLLLITVIIVTASILFVSLSANANDSEHQPSYKYYKSIEITKGDTLWSIAQEYSDDAHYKNTSDYIKEVRNINSLTSDNIISGSYIIVPYYSN